MLYTVHALQAHIPVRGICHFFRCLFIGNNRQCVSTFKHHKAFFFRKRRVRKVNAPQTQFLHACPDDEAAYGTAGKCPVRYFGKPASACHRRKIAAVIKSGFSHLRNGIRQNHRCYPGIAHKHFRSDFLYPFGNGYFFRLSPVGK